MAMRMAVSPAQRLSSVNRFGTSMRTGMRLWRNKTRRRLRRSPSSSLGSIWSMGVLALSSTAPLLHARFALGLRRLEVGQHRLAADRALADRDECAVTRRQVEVDARAEPDQAEALADAHAVALSRKCHDAPRDQPGDLHDRDLHAVGTGYDEPAPLILLARLVDRCVEEAAGHIDRAHDASGNRRAVDVDVEHR